jgi:hypothetical protein
MRREQTGAWLAERRVFRNRYDKGIKIYGFCFGTGSGVLGAEPSNSSGKGQAEMAD